VTCNKRLERAIPVLLPKTPPNFQAFQEKFGHCKSPDSSRTFSLT
jgi:hypothetical protein